jgi:flagellar P-ring protein FlgI
MKWHCFCKYFIKIFFNFYAMQIFLLFICFISCAFSQSGENQSSDDNAKGITHKGIVRTLAAKNKTLETRIKDIAQFTTMRDNQLVGYGLVVGLNGTGDTLASSPYTKESLVSMLERLGVNVRDKTSLSGKNVAAVMVTANLPPFAKQGSRIDISVSALGDAKDLKGGTLLVTPLLAADGEVYAVAQGALYVSSLNVTGIAASANSGGVPTSGKIPNGAIVEKEVKFQLTSFSKQILSLRNPDLTTSKRINDAINKHFGQKIATALDNSSVEIFTPSNIDTISLMTQIEQLSIEPDQTAKVIIDTQGVIVLGNRVRISQVAVNHGNITVRVAEGKHVSQPNPFTNVGQNFSQSNNNLQSPSTNIMQPQFGQNKKLPDIVYVQQATVTDDTKIKVEEEKGKFAIIDRGADLEELVNALNILGTSPREMAQILNNIKLAGALQAEIIVN